MANKEKDRLDLKETSKELGEPLRNLRRKVEKGKIPGKKEKGKYLIDEAVVRAMQNPQGFFAETIDKLKTLPDNLCKIYPELCKLNERIEQLEKGKGSPIEIPEIPEVPSDLCEKWPDLCKLLEKQEEEKDDYHLTVEEALNCPHCNQKFKELMEKETGNEEESEEEPKEDVIDLNYC